MKNSDRKEEAFILSVANSRQRFPALEVKIKLSAMPLASSLKQKDTTSFFLFLRVPMLNTKMRQFYKWTHRASYINLVRVLDASFCLQIPSLSHIGVSFYGECPFMSSY